MKSLFFVIFILFLPTLMPSSAWAVPLPDRDPMALLGPHADYKIEWWYVTGFLKTRRGEHLGFQGTFFRFKLAYSHPKDLPSSPWEPREVLSFHGAISFLDRKIFVSREMSRRSFRESVGTTKTPFSIFIGENKLLTIKTTPTGEPVFHLKERVKGNFLDLSLFPETRILWQDPTGRLKTGPGERDWAWYYSYPKITVTGTFSREDNKGKIKTQSVSGEAWFDHEWTNSALGKDQIGWIWMWGTFKFPQETKGFMMFQMIKKDGTLDNFYKGGTLFTFSRNTWKITYQRSNELQFYSFDFKKLNNSCLPNRIRFKFTNFGKVGIFHSFSKQELKGNSKYWEGAINLTLKGQNKLMNIGKGYLELTGLDGKKNNCHRIK